jgi:hypothetical protein
LRLRRDRVRVHLVVGRHAIARLLLLLLLLRLWRVLRVGLLTLLILIS